MPQSFSIGTDSKFNWMVIFIKFQPTSALFRPLQSFPEEDYSCKTTIFVIITSFDQSKHLLDSSTNSCY